MFAIAAMTAMAITSFQAAATTQAEIVPQIDWDVSLVKFQFDHEKFVGQRFVAECFPGSVAKLDIVLHGTGTYPSDTPICAAAKHAGKIDETGGLVTVQLNPGADSYTGSTQNGVTSATLPATARSIVFVDAESQDPASQFDPAKAPLIKWDASFTKTGFAYQRLVGQRFTFRCPPVRGDLPARRIVGTDIYAYNNKVCLSAVHAGTLTGDGGLVTVQMQPGKQKLVGSIRNGIESKSGTSGIQALIFVENPDGLPR